MVPLALLIVQTVPAAAPEPGSATSAVDRPCAAGPDVTGDVVVCARTRDADRLRAPSPLASAAPRFDPFLFRLPGGASGRFHAFQRTLSGAVSQGVAVTVTVPLGGKH